MKANEMKDLFYADRYGLIREFLIEQGIDIKIVERTFKTPQLRIQYEDNLKTERIVEALKTFIEELDKSLNLNKGSIRLNISYIGSDNEMKIVLVLKR